MRNKNIRPAEGIETSRILAIAEHFMRHYQTFRGADIVHFCNLNLNLPPKVDMQSIARIEIYDATMAEDGEDFCEIRVIDTSEQIVFIDRVFSFKMP